MTITVTKQKIAQPAEGDPSEKITIDLRNDSNGTDLNIGLTLEDARILSEKILAALLKSNA